MGGWEEELRRTFAYLSSLCHPASCGPSWCWLITYKTQNGSLKLHCNILPQSFGAHTEKLGLCEALLPTSLSFLFLTVVYEDTDGL